MTESEGVASSASFKHQSKMTNYEIVRGRGWGFRWSVNKSKSVIPESRIGANNNCRMVARLVKLSVEQTGLGLKKQSRIPHNF